MDTIKKHNEFIKKLFIYIILFFTVLMLQTNAYGATIELRNDPEMDVIICNVINWYTDHPDATASEVAEQIVIETGGDLEKIKRLQNTFVDNKGGVVWSGGNTDSIYYKATDVAIKATENGNKVEPGNKKEQEELYNKIISKASKLYGKKMTEEELKELDNLLKEYLNKYSSLTNDSNLEQMKRAVREQLANFGQTGNTAADEDSIRNEEHEKENQKPDEVSGLLGKSEVLTDYTPDKIIGNAQDFKNAGNTGDKTISINGNKVKEGSDTLFNILLSIGIFLSVAIGMYIGVKIMLSNAEDKAKVKEALIPYGAGCVVIFGAFAIWKTVIILLSGIQ